MIYRFVSLYNTHDDLECSRKMYVTARRSPCLWKQEALSENAISISKGSTMILSTVDRTVWKAFPIVQEKANVESTTSPWLNDKGLRMWVHSHMRTQPDHGIWNRKRCHLTRASNSLQTKLYCYYTPTRVGGFCIENYTVIMQLFLLYWTLTVFLAMFVRPLEGCACIPGIVLVSRRSSWLIPWTIWPCDGRCFEICAMVAV